MGECDYCAKTLAIRVLPRNPRFHFRV